MSERKVYVIRVGDEWVSSPTDTRTTKPALAACWREGELSEARALASQVGGTVEPYARVRSER